MDREVKVQAVSPRAWGWIGDSEGLRSIRGGDIRYREVKVQATSCIDGAWTNNFLAISLDRGSTLVGIGGVRFPALRSKPC